MDTPPIQWPTIVTALVALYGAAISTYTLLASRMEKKRKIKVELSIGFLTYEPDAQPMISPTMLLIIASNTGHRTVTLTSVGFILPNGNQGVFLGSQSNPSLPYDLEEGRTPCVTSADAKQLFGNLRLGGLDGKIKLTGFYRDGTGAIHKSKPTKFNIDEWTRV